jgi:hypothetical protein
VGVISRLLLLDCNQHTCDPNSMLSVGRLLVFIDIFCSYGVPTLKVSVMAACLLSHQPNLEPNPNANPNTEGVGGGSVSPFTSARGGRRVQASVAHAVARVLFGEWGNDGLAPVRELLLLTLAAAAFALEVGWGRARVLRCISRLFRVVHIVAISCLHFLLHQP